MTRRQVDDRVALQSRLRAPTGSIRPARSAGISAAPVHAVTTQNRLAA